MHNSYNMSQFLMNTNEGVSYEEFSKSFYRSLRLFGQVYTESQYDKFVKALFALDEIDYKSFYKIFMKLGYPFFKTNSELITSLVAANESRLLQISYDMFKKKESIVSRALSIRATVTSVNEKKEELLMSLKNILLSIQNNEDGNILKQAQEEFVKFYGDYADDKLLGDFYKFLFDRIELQLLSEIEKEMVKFDAIKDKLIDREYFTMSFEHREYSEKNHRKTVFFKQTF